MTEENKHEAKNEKMKKSKQEERKEAAAGVKSGSAGQIKLSRRKVLAAMGVAGLAVASGTAGAFINRGVDPNDESAAAADQEMTNYRVYDTVEEMRQDPGLIGGTYAKTMGYYKPGDGGGAEYVIIESEYSRNADGGSVIELANEKHYALLTNVEAVNYKMFGAVGDGQNDDGKQIKNAHMYANQNQLPVVNLSGEYWIKYTKGIFILTNVNWGHTKFHIDESLNTKTEPRFEVRGRKMQQKIQLNAQQKASFLSKLKPGVKVIPELADYKNCLVVVQDTNDRIGYRAGERYDGQSWAREELFYVEEHGRIIGDIAWEFKDYTSLTAYPCDDNYLIIEGGTFYISGDNPGVNYEGYWHNGFRIQRSRTIIRNQWVGLEEGHEDVSMDPRHGFYNFSHVYDVTLENIRLIPYEQDREGTDRDVPAGTYGISGNRILNATFRKVTAEGSPVHWGIFGTNLNKNFRIEQCTLNRVDVHFHCWNLTIKDTQIGYRGISITGGGELIVENTSRYGNQLINFRRDFGAKWDGNITIRNCRLMPAGNGEVSVLYFMTDDFDHKYPIGYGRHVFIDNLVVDYASAPENRSACWLMKISTFSKTSDGLRLFFPYHVEFRNISVVGREDGVRLVEIPNPQQYDMGRAGSYDGTVLAPNCRMIFENIQLSKLPAAPAASKSHNHLYLGSAAGDEYEDERALYPEIRISGCHGFSGYFGGSIADVYIERSIISRLTAEEGGPMRGKLAFADCTFKADVRDDSADFFALSAELGTSFTNCILAAPSVGGEDRPDLADRSGFIEINRRVRYNHLNTRLGNDLLKHIRESGTTLNSRFISMLKNHHELESDTV